MLSVEMTSRQAPPDPISRRRPSPTSSAHGSNGRERFSDNELEMGGGTGSIGMLDVDIGSSTVDPTPLLSGRAKSKDGEDETDPPLTKSAAAAASAAAKMSMATSIFNLANNVAGSGMLTLPSGKASGSGTGWIPSLLLLVGAAFAASHTFALIGKCCEMTGARTFRGLWVSAFGPGRAWCVDGAIFVQCFLGCVIYSGLLGDIFSSLLLSSGLVLPATTYYSTRSLAIAVLSVFVLWPLNMIRNLSALGFTSVLGLIAVLYTVLFVTVRALDGTYDLTTDPPGRFVSDGSIDMPTFERSSIWHVGPSTLVLVSNLSLSFVAHYNAPAYWRELDGATSFRFTQMANGSYAILVLIYALAMCGGYATFGDACRGNLLLNYHPADSLAAFGRLATGLSIVFGFPLVMAGARESLKSTVAGLWGYQIPTDPRNHTRLVVTLLGLVSYVAATVGDIKPVAGLSGSAVGSFLVYVCPAMLYSRIVRNVSGGEGSPEYRAARRKCLVLVPFGICTAVLGVAMTVQEAMRGSSRGAVEMSR